MVKIESGSIEEITPTGIKMDGMAEEFDIIVCATGFDISFCPAWEMIGKDGSRLADQWRESPEAYFGICAPNVPNHFICNGPNCLIGHGSLLAVMDWTANWIVRWCRKIATEDIKAVRVSDSACDDYNVFSQEFLKRTAWASGCKSWYKNGKKFRFMGNAFTVGESKGEDPAYYLKQLSRVKLSVPLDRTNLDRLDLRDVHASF